MGSKRQTRAAALGFRAHKGWAAAVAVTDHGGAPRLVHSSIVETGRPGDRLSSEPYHVAAGIDGATRTERPADPEAIIARGRRLQDEAAASTVGELAAELARKDLTVVAGAMLITRSWLGHDLEHILAFPEHVRVYEAEAVRAAIRSGLSANGIPVVDCDEKSMLQFTADSNGWSEAEVRTVLAELGAQAGRPWRQDQKLAALAAWAALRKASA